MQNYFPQEQKSKRTNREYVQDALIAIIPATITIMIINGLGIKGALVPVIIIILFPYLVGRLRIRLKNNKESKS